MWSSLEDAAEDLVCVFHHLPSGAEVLKKLFLVVCGVGRCPGLCPISTQVDVQAKGQELLTALSLFGCGNPTVGGDGWMLGVISLMRSPLGRVELWLCIVTAGWSMSSGVPEVGLGASCCSQPLCR